MTGSRRLLVLLSLAGVLIGVTIGSYKVGENRGGGPGASANRSGTATGARTASTTETSGPSSHTPEVWPFVGPTCTGNQLQLDQCAQRTYKGEQRLLMTVLEDLRAHLNPAERTALDLSQQRWHVYVDGFCTAINGGEGSIAPMLAANCRAILTHQRIIDVCQWAVPASDLAAIVNPPETCRPYHS